MRCPGPTFTNRLASAGLLALSLASCVSASWTRESKFSAPDLVAFEQFAVGEDTLPTCLEQLGAPLWVWEAAGGQHAMAWGWLEDKNFGVRASIPLARFASASFSYARIDQRMQGIVLFFDAAWNLVGTRRGQLRDLTELEERRRPGIVESS